MYAITSYGIGKPVTARLIQPDWDLVEGESFKVEHWEPGMVLAAEGEAVVMPAEDVPIVPSIVSRRQARRALRQAGLLDLVQTTIDAIPDQDLRADVQIDWDDATEFKRDDPTLTLLAQALGLSSEALDRLFIDAAQY